jgi:hypothetical protein
MARRKKNLVSKLGSWTEQANLSRTAPLPATTEAPVGAEAASQAKREEYLVSRSLIERIADTAKKHGMQQNQVVGYLLTWALDQVDAGKLEMKAT